MLRSPNDESTPVQKRKIERDENVAELAAVARKRRRNPRENHQAAAVAEKLLLREMLGKVGSKLRGQRAVAGGDASSRERCGRDRGAAECEEG